MTQEEEWRSVPGWEETHEASSFGRIRSLDRQALGRGFVMRDIQGGILIPRPTLGGFERVALCHDHKRDDLLCGDVVLAAFTGSFPESQRAWHKDGNDTNCAVENLEWLDTEEAVARLRKRTEAESSAKKKSAKTSKQATPPCPGNMTAEQRANFADALEVLAGVYRE